MKRHHLNPIWLFLRYIVHSGFSGDILDKQEQAFVEDNINKHTWSLIIVMAMWPFTVYGLRSLEGDQTVTLAIVFGLGTLAAAFIGAWFSITFAGIKRKLEHVGMSVTFWMYTVMNAATSACLISMAWISPWPLWILYGIIYIAFLFTTIQYDTSDGLKVGLDETVLTHGRYAIAHYRSEGIEPSAKEDE